jgi:hypothetical protein
MTEDHATGFTQTFCQFRHSVSAVGTVLAAVGFAIRISPNAVSSVITVRLVNPWLRSSAAS